MILQEEDMTYVSLEKAVRLLYKNRQKYIKNMENSHLSDGVNEVIKIITKQ